jgi:threonine aldolase
VGSLLVGSKADIKKARQIRKIFGGGMRQAGFIAAAGIYALENNIERLKDDHKRAKLLGETLQNLPFVDSLMPIDTNIVVANINAKHVHSDIIEKLKQKGILTIAFGSQQIRMVTHLNFTDEML